MEHIAQQAGIRQLHLANDRDYSIQVLPALIGMEIGERIYTAMAPAIAAAFDGNPDANIFAESTFFTNIAIAMVQGSEKLKLVETTKALFKNVACDGEPIEFNTHFAGLYGEMFEVMGFILKENFGELFTKIFKDKLSQIHTLKTALKTLQGVPTPEQLPEE